MPWSSILSTDWLCASSSALMVCGDIMRTAATGPEPSPRPTEADEVEDGRSNRLLAFWLAPVDLRETISTMSAP